MKRLQLVKKFTLLLIFQATLTMMWSQPPINDDCTLAVSIIPSTNYLCDFVNTSGTTLNATSSGLVDACSGDGDDDVWYKFVATHDTHYAVVNPTGGTNPDLVMAFYNGNCVALDSITCVNNSGTYASEEIVISGIAVGDTLFIRIYEAGTGPSDAEFELCVYSPPSNDACEDATLLTISPDEYLEGSYNQEISIALATQSPLSTCVAIADYYDLWYKFVPTLSRHLVTLDVNSGGDIALDAFSGTGCTSLNLLNCINADTSGQDEILDLQNLTIGDTVYVRAYDASGDGDTINFSIHVTTPPVNDFCANATLIQTTNGITCNDPINGSTSRATGTGGCNGGFADDDIWYKFIATDSVHLITLQNTLIQNPKIELFEDSCMGTSIYCMNGVSHLVSGLMPNSLYLIRIYSNDSLNGNGSFNICISEPPTNVLCQNPDTLAVNQDTVCQFTYTGNTIGLGYEQGWYTFVATHATHIFYVTPLPPVTSTGLNPEIFDETCTGLGFMGSEYFGGVQRLFYNEFTVGERYKMKIGAGYPTEGIFNLCIISPVENDECAQAVEIIPNTDCSCTLSVTGNCAYATPSNPNGGCSQVSMDVWYKFTATTPKSAITITPINGATGGFVQVFGPNQCTSSFSCSSSGTTNLTNLTPGAEYFISVKVTNNDGSPGAFNLCIKNLSEDYCASPLIINPAPSATCVSPLSGSTIGATVSGYNTGCGSANAPDVWYQFTALATTHAIRVTPATPGFDPTISLYRKSNSGAFCDMNCTSTYLTCGDITSINLQPEVLVATGLTIGHVYLVQVRRTANSMVEGNFDICVTSPGTTKVLWSSEYETYDTLSVPSGTWARPTKRITLHMSGTAGTTTVNQIVVNLIGTTNTNDILSAKMYYGGASNASSSLGSNSVFSATGGPGQVLPVQFGSTIANPSGTLSFNGSQAIVSSSSVNYKRYFYLVLDIACDATNGNDINAAVTSLTFNAVNHTPFAGNNEVTEISAFTTHHTIADGLWTTPSTWLCNAPPPNAPDNAPVSVNHQVSVSSPVQTGDVIIKHLKTLTISTTGILTLGNHSMGSSSGFSNTYLNCLDGNLNINGGVVNVNGLTHVGHVAAGVSYGSLSITNGGHLNIDGNDGVTEESSGLYLGTSNLTATGGGFIDILDPSYDSPEFIYEGNADITNINWTLTIGGGDDTLVFSNPGFNLIQGSSSLKVISFQHVIAKGGMYQSRRFVQGVNDIFCNNLTVEPNGELMGILNVSGNIINNGVITSSQINLASQFKVTTFATNPNLQSISGSGFYRRDTLSPYPLNKSENTIGRLLCNNSNSQGIQLMVPMQVANELMIKTGKIVNADTSLLTLGSAHNPGLLCATHSASFHYIPVEFTGAAGTWTGGYVYGPFRRFFNNPTGANKWAMPVGKGSENRLVSLLFEDTHPTYVTAEYFNADPGNSCIPIVNEQSINITNVSPTGYWSLKSDNPCGGYEAHFNAGSFTKRGGGSITDIPSTRIIKRPFSYKWDNSCATTVITPQVLNNFIYKSQNPPCNTDTNTAGVLRINSPTTGKFVTFSIADDNNNMIYQGGPVSCGSYPTNLNLPNGCYTLTLNISNSANFTPCTNYDTLFTIHVANNLVQFGPQSIYTAVNTFPFCVNNGNVPVSVTNCNQLNSDFGLGGGIGAVGPDITPTTRYVLNSNDSGVGSLRYQIENSVCNDTIKFDPSLNGDTIFLLSSLMQIEKNIYLFAGPSQQISIQLQSDEKLFEIKPHVKMVIDNLNMMANGNFNGYIITNEGQLTLKDIEMSSSENSNTNIKIVNKVPGNIYVEGINLIMKD